MIYLVDGDEYHYNYEMITNALAPLSHIEIVEIAPCVTGELVEIYVCLTLRLEQHTIIKFLYLTADSVKKTDRLVIGQLGEWEFQTCWLGEGCSQQIHNITIGNDSELSDVFDFEIRNIQEVVAHYHDILSIIERFPDISEATTDTPIDQIMFYKKQSQ